MYLNRLVSKGCKLVGCGSATPTLKVSNDDLAKIVDTSDEWISVRTGIRNRRVLSGKLLFFLGQVSSYLKVTNGCHILDSCVVCCDFLGPSKGKK